MERLRKLLVILLILSLGLVACRKRDLEEGIGGLPLERPAKISQSEVDDGYFLLLDIGIKSKASLAWRSYEGRVLFYDIANLDIQGYRGVRGVFLDKDNYEKIISILEGDQPLDIAQELIDQAIEESLAIWQITLVDRYDEEGRSSLDDKFNFTKTELIGSTEKNSFYFSQLEEEDLAEYNLDSEDERIARELIEGIDELKANLEYFDPPQALDRPEMDGDLDYIEFDSKTLDGGNLNSEDFFQENDINLVNIWASLCKPCIDEIPEIEKIYQEYKDQIGVLGVLVDVKLDMENSREAKLARDILDQTGASYKNIFLDPALGELLDGQVRGVPTSLVVDSQGRLLGEISLGAMDYKAFKKLIDFHLDK